MISLAVKYRPSTFNDVVEQDSIKTILRQQLDSNEVKHAYLFCGGAGTGKTTCARIFANEINQGKGNPIEMDAASNSGVEDVRNIIQQAKSKSLDSEYKVFIVDECHAISLMGWQAFLKMLEEPPAKSIFIFCTTDPQKIPKTILSRVQRYDFSRISQDGIVERLEHIINEEWKEHPDWDAECDRDAVEYLAKIADGGMRDAITLMDKALSFDKDLTLENVVKALGTTNYDLMFQLTDAFVYPDSERMMTIIDNIHAQGKDLKRFIKTYIQFLLDVNKLALGCDWKQLSLPHLEEYEKRMNKWLDDNDIFTALLNAIVKIDSDLKYSSTPKYEIEAKMLLWIEGGTE
jgi:DNA polymerase-3 subunit gamma/tau